MRHKHVYWLRERNQLRGRARNYKERDKADLKEVVGNDHILVCRTASSDGHLFLTGGREGRKGKGRDRLIH